MQNPDPSWPQPAVRNVAKHFAAYNLESDFAGRTTPADIAKGNGQYVVCLANRIPVLVACSS